MLTFVTSMKTVNKLLLTGTAFLVGSPLASAVQWPYKSLNENLAEADLVVVGKIESDMGRANPPPGDKLSRANTWTSKLKITRVLKGSATEKEVTVQWDEIRLGGVPGYKPGEERIWILKKSAGVGMYSTGARPDTVLLPKELPAVETELKKHGIEPGGSANGSQPIRSETNSTPGAVNSPLADAGDDTLLHVMKKSDLVVSVVIASDSQATFDEVGAALYGLECRVTEVLHGQLPSEQKLRIQVMHPELEAGDKLTCVNKDSRCILFLKRDRSGTYWQEADVWFTVQRYNSFMARRVRQLSKELEKATTPNEDIAWGEPKDGIRVGLSPAKAVFGPDEKAPRVRVWYENVGLKPAKVPDHKDANMYTLMFAGSLDGRAFHVAHLEPRDETLGPFMKPLVPGERFSEEFRLGSREPDWWVGLPDLKPRQTLTLQAGWTAFNDAGTAEHWNDPRTRTSGKITVERAAEPPAKQLTSEAVTRAKDMKQAVSHFALHLTFEGPSDKPYYGLRLSVEPLASDNPFEPAVTITPQQAEKIIAYLATDGFLEYAVDLRNKKLPQPTMPGYTLRRTKGTFYFLESWCRFLVQIDDARRRLAIK
jgi:hypothetical protein